MDINAQSKFMETESISLMEELELRSPDVNVGYAWRPTEDGTKIILVGGEVSLFKEANTFTDPELEHEPVIQYCRDLPDDTVTAIVEDKLVAVGEDLEAAVNQLYELIVSEI